jgi:two-component system response regulator CpxR
MVVSSIASARQAALVEKRGARERGSEPPARQLRTAALRRCGHLTKLGMFCNTGCAMFTGPSSGKSGLATMTLPASLLIVDDDRELGQMLTEYLTDEGFQVTLLRDGAEALERLIEQIPPFDLVILDVMLPSLSGFEVLRRLRHSLSVPVIMLTAHGADVDRIVGLELGADDYLSKPFNPRELVARVRAVLRRFSPRDADMPAHPVSVGPLRLDPATFEVTLSGQSVRLTGTELRLLEVLMRAVGQVQSRESLTERVLGRRLTPYDRSIDTHVSNLRRKLGLGENGLPEIRSIRGAGYVLIATSSETRSPA